MKLRGYSTYFRIGQYSNLSFHFSLFLVFALLTNSCDFVNTNEPDKDVGFLIVSFDKDGNESITELFDPSIENSNNDYELLPYSTTSLVLVNTETYSPTYIISPSGDQFVVNSTIKMSTPSINATTFNKHAGQWHIQEENVPISIPNYTSDFTSNLQSDIFKFHFQNGETQALKRFSLESKFSSDSVFISYTFEKTYFSGDIAFIFKEHVYSIIKNNVEHTANFVLKSEQDILVCFDPEKKKDPLLIPLESKTQSEVVLFRLSNILYTSIDYVIFNVYNSGVNTTYKASVIEDGLLITKVCEDNQRFKGAFDGILIIDDNLVDAKTLEPLQLSIPDSLLNFNFKQYDFADYVLFVVDDYYANNVTGDYTFYKYNKKTREFSNSITLARNVDIYIYYFMRDRFEPVTLANGTTYLIIGQTYRKNQYY
jgi:hypothetical protein